MVHIKQKFVLKMFVLIRFHCSTYVGTYVRRYL